VLARSAVLLGVLAAASAADVALAEGEQPVADDATIVALAVALACADPAAGAPAAVPRGPTEQAAVELAATVRAEALRFDEVPAPDTILAGRRRA
jgi:hypothetical protein